MKRTPALCFALACAAAAISPQVRAQSGGEIVLLDAKSMGDWDKLGESNWRFEDGAAVAEGKNATSPQNYLVSKQSFKNFVLTVEFWSSDDANSGVFIRCSDPKKVGDHTCYEANIFDQRPDQTYGTGSITHYAEVNPMPKAGGKWNTYEITAKGRQITVMLNGQKTAELHNNMWIEGPIALQHGAGTVKFRKVTVKPL
jgi:hypothetical protein